MKLWRWLRRLTVALQVLCAAAAVAVFLLARFGKPPARTARTRSYEPPAPVIPESSPLPYDGKLTPLPSDSGPSDKN